MDNPYKILGVAEHASIAEIKAAFRRIAKSSHPDLNNGNSQLTAQFREAAEAYSILSDPIKKNHWDTYRAAYDLYDYNGYSTEDYNEDSVTAADIENYIHRLYAQVEPYKDAARKSALIGLAWFLGGLIISVGSYLAAANGDSYTITWGAILFGAIQAGRGFLKYAEITNVVREAESEMWRVFS
jgi:curved DNA-binding protein CbpA